MIPSVGGAGARVGRAVSVRKRRECPRCKASPGQPCHRWAGQGEIKYKVPLKSIHRER